MIHTFNKELHELYPVFFLSLLATTGWIVLIDLAQYIFTHLIYIWNEISPLANTCILIGMIIAISLLQVRKITPFMVLTSGFLLLLVLAGHQYYQDYMMYLEKFPKVQSISKNWTIQGDRIIISGRNFGPEWSPGKVKVGELSFENVRWSDRRVVVEQPVPSSFFQSMMTLENHYGNSTVVTDTFFIKNPDEVL